MVLFLGVVTFWIWYYAAGPLMRLRCAADQWLLSPGVTERLERRVEQLTETRADAVDHSAAELRRLERDLHDGAQARLVALSLSLGMADEMFERDPDGARRLVSDARETTDTALAELRSVVRGIHPPVLADRGLVGAAQALALDMAVPVRVDGRPWTGGRRPRSSRRSTSRSPSAWPTSASTPAPRTGGSASTTPTACCAWRSATTGAAAPTRPAAPA